MYDPFLVLNDPSWSLTGGMGSGGGPGHGADDEVGLPAGVVENAGAEGDGRLRGGCMGNDGWGRRGPRRWSQGGEGCCQMKIRGETTK